MIYKILFSPITEFIISVIGWSFMFWIFQLYEYKIDNYILYALLPIIFIGLIYVFIVKKYLFPLISNKIKLERYYNKMIDKLNEI